MRTSVSVAVVFVALAFGATRAGAADSPAGTWVKKDGRGKVELTMTIESWGVGNTQLSYASKQPGAAVSTVMSNLDGADSPVVVNGKATPATVAITLVDQRHATVISKMNLQPVGTSKWTFSPDFKTLTIENDFALSADGTPAGKSVERWTRP